MEQEEASVMKFDLIHRVKINGYMSLEIDHNDMEQILQDRFPDFVERLREEKQQAESEDSFVDELEHELSKSVFIWIDEQLFPKLNNELNALVEEVKQVYDVRTAIIDGETSTYTNHKDFFKVYLHDFYRGEKDKTRNEHTSKLKMFSEAIMMVSTVFTDQDCFNYNSCEHMLLDKVSNPLVDIVDNHKSCYHYEKSLYDYVCDVDKVYGEIDDLERFFDAFIH